MFKTIDSAIKWIESVKKFGSKLDLSRMHLACEILGHPERDLTVIHIAGTNGKGSTVAFLNAMLREAGYHVGTYTSPYIVRFNERISLDDTPISDDTLLTYINQVYDLHYRVLKEHGQVITFFELVTLISFLYFKDQAPDFVLYEVGLGGTLDATNVVHPILTAITSISYDHMSVLGNTLSSIALNKLGIVKPGIPLITTVDQAELKPLFKKVTKERDAPYYPIDVNDIDKSLCANKNAFTYHGMTYEIPLLGSHQPNNAVLAIELMAQLKNMKKITYQDHMVQAGLLKTTWPGRMEKFGNTFLDGAHNIGGIQALAETVHTLFQDQTVHVLYTSMADKEYFDVIQVIERFADTITFTQFDYPRCETARNLYQVSLHPNKDQSINPIDAYERLNAIYPNDIILITGSLYFVSLMRKHLINESTQ
ncbi:MAG: bifunctional folylpolyglutamate synthase/dihydrofolate synthase [Candidatus Izimaplasma sp.]|nr:bifunctional folylpolyglutamate synthase/dihydrofolate synthase [Candidatus Izimaplasma bacterium]